MNELKISRSYKCVGRKIFIYRVMLAQLYNMYFQSESNVLDEKFCTRLPKAED